MREASLWRFGKRRGRRGNSSGFSPHTPHPSSATAWVWAAHWGFGLSSSVVTILITNLECFQAKIPKCSFSLCLVLSVTRIGEVRKLYRAGQGGLRTAILRDSPARMLVKRKPGLRNPLSGADYHFTTRILPLVLRGVIHFQRPVEAGFWPPWGFSRSKAVLRILRQ